MQRLRSTWGEARQLYDALVSQPGLKVLIVDHIDAIGSDAPIDSNNTEDALAHNRCIVFRAPDMMTT